MPCHSYPGIGAARALTSASIKQPKAPLETPDDSSATESANSTTSTQRIQHGAVVDERDIGGEVDQELLQELQAENAELVREFESTLDQVRIVENQVAEISQLQDQFVGQVSQQAEAIDEIHHMTTTSTQHVRQGVDNLRQAAEHSADSHTFIVVLLVTLAFALLFIHWYD
jgi:t-SNARE complex subunit (syntaxin)